MKNTLFETKISGTKVLANLELVGDLAVSVESYEAQDRNAVLSEDEMDEITDQYNEQAC